MKDWPVVVICWIVYLLTVQFEERAIDRYSFYGEWFDPSAQFTRKFLLTFFINDDTLEMYELKTRRIFLKRIYVEGVQSSDFYIGNVINVLSRAVKITDFADSTTREYLSHLGERTLGLVKTEGVPKLGKILQMANEAGFRVVQARMLQLRETEAEEFYEEHKDRTFFPKLVDYMTSGQIVAMELVREDAVRAWRELIGPTDPAQAKLEAPDSIRAKFGTDKTYNAVHGSDAVSTGKRELKMFFPEHRNGVGTTKKDLNHPTSCIILPHVFAQGLSGDIINYIQEAGFRIEALRTFTMTRSTAEEFLEVYKGVVPEFQGMVTQLSSGPALGVALSSDHGEDTVKKFRELVGPSDPDLARELRPQTLRALWGVDKLKNGIHCADLPEDGLLEVQFLFSILQ